MSGFAFEQNKGHAVVRFEAILPEMSWGDVEKEGAEIIAQLKSANTARLIIDLSPMTLIQSGLVASLVRMWKATDGHTDRKVVIATDNEVVRDVIRSAGLFNLFTMVNTPEEAAVEIKVVTEAEVEHREKQVVALLAFPAALIGAAALYPALAMEGEGLQHSARLTALVAGGAASVAAVFSLFKDEGARRRLGLVALLIGLTTLGVVAAKWPESEQRDDGTTVADPETNSPTPQSTDDSGGKKHKKDKPPAEKSPADTPADDSQDAAPEKAADGDEQDTTDDPPTDETSAETDTAEPTEEEATAEESS